MIVAIGSDHGGFNLKEEIKKMLTQQNVEFRDFGTHSAEAIDYPEIASKIGQAVVSGECTRGIIICGTGIGVSIAANKIKGIRAALCHDEFSAQMSREHNDANILTMGERVIGAGLACMIVATWLKTDFAGGRHGRRVDKISQLEA
ncbi:MAG: ribose 5-phosphate isomerase [Firmicutes bacterium]|nr:ribose 5-phosphate isomerase [Bacillota bacterium]